VRIATWNLNSVKARLPRLLAWLDERQPDVLLVQETKSTQDAWPALSFLERGYESDHHGAGRWNGVGVLSRVGLEEVLLGLPGQPAFDGVVEARAMAATCGGLRLWSVYVPNGRAVGSPHYAYKLAFLERLREVVAAEQELRPEQPFGVLGDLNVAPHDVDVWDPAAFATATHVTPAERQALADLGLHDLPPRASADPADSRPAWTFWEMRMLGFQKGRGMRIDLALVNDELRARAVDVWVDRDARKGVGPSDHAPLVVDLS
jgi:exodeoxyribonuclease III